MPYTPPTLLDTRNFGIQVSFNYTVGPWIFEFPYTGELSNTVNIHVPSIDDRPPEVWEGIVTFPEHLEILLTSGPHANSILRGQVLDVNSQGFSSATANAFAFGSMNGSAPYNFEDSLKLVSALLGLCVGLNGTKEHMRSIA